MADQLVVGAPITITVGGQTVAATVVEVAENGQLIGIQFDDPFRLPTGGWVGQTLPLLFVGGAQWVDALSDTLVELRPVARH